MVEIKVHTPFSEFFEMGQRLSIRYGLLDAVVVPSGEEALQTRLAQAAADLLMQRVQREMSVGVGVGRTVAAIPEFFRPAEPVSCRFIGLTGGLDMRQTGLPHTFDTLSRLANAAQGEAFYIPAPSYVADPAAQKVLLSEQAVVQGLRSAQACDMAVFSIGAADYTALLYQYNQVTAQDVREMQERGVVGDVLGRFFDSSGHEVDLEINRRIIGLRLEALKNIPIKILAAGGENKRSALRTAVEHGFCEILVTDEVSAAWLLA